jgi:ketosteroid isomerase-like protein
MHGLLFFRYSAFNDPPGDTLVTNIPATAAYFRSLNERNITMFMACFAGDCEAHSPFGEPPYKGRTNVSKMLGQRTKCWRRLRVIPKSASRSGNRIAVMWMADGTTQTGKCASFEGVSVFEVDDAGKIMRLEEYWDARAALREAEPLEKV